jgi:hypothetical protein
LYPSKEQNVVLDIVDILLNLIYCKNRNTNRQEYLEMDERRGNPNKPYWLCDNLGNNVPLRKGDILRFQLDQAHNVVMSVLRPNQAPKLLNFVNTKHSMTSVEVGYDPIGEINGRFGRIAQQQAYLIGAVCNLDPELTGNDGTVLSYTL